MKFFVATLLIVVFSQAQARTWTFENCQSTLTTFPSEKQFEVIASLRLSHLTGQGHGQVSLDNSVPVSMDCRFMTEMTYGLLGTPRPNEWILCETQGPIHQNLKLGIPFNVTGDKAAINPVTYLQFENGNAGHGTFDGFSCLVQ